MGLGYPVQVNGWSESVRTAQLDKLITEYGIH